MTNILNYICAKNLPLVIISVVNNLTPLLTLFLCFILLKEKITKTDVVYMIIAFLTTIPIVSGNFNDNKTTGFLYILALFFNCFLTSSGTITMREMRNLHEYVVSFYLNLTLLISSYLICIFFHNSFEILRHFTVKQHFIAFSLGLFVII